MIHECDEKSKYYFVIKNIVQIIFVFIFLTLFFYNYVSLVEKKEFGEQLELSVNSLYSENKDILKDVKNKINAGENSEELTDKDIALLTALDAYKYKQYNINKEKDKNISDSNNKIKQKSYSLLYMAVGIITILLLLVVFSGICKSPKTILYESLLSIVAIAMTEVLFLNLIAKNYVSADNNYIKYNIAKNINEYYK